MTKEQALQLIERLEDKTGKKDVLLNDVLTCLESKKGNTQETYLQDEEINDNCWYLMQLWYVCLKDHSPSLFAILEETEWEEIIHESIVPGRAGPFRAHIQHLKSPAKELFEFLATLFTDK